MDTTIYTFPPDLSGTKGVLWTALLAALAAGAGAYALLRSRSAGNGRQMRQLLAMLLFFVFLIGTGTALFSWWTIRKLTPVRIYADAIETPYGKVDFEHLRNASIQVEAQHSFVDPSLIFGRHSVLEIEVDGGKTQMLSEKYYDLPVIMKGLKEVVGKWKDAGG